MAGSISAAENPTAAAAGASALKQGLLLLGAHGLVESGAGEEPVKRRRTGVGLGGRGEGDVGLGLGSELWRRWGRRVAWRRRRRRSGGGREGEGGKGKGGGGSGEVETNGVVFGGLWGPGVEDWGGSASQ